jgi:hypothetical protein
MLTTFMHKLMHKLKHKSQVTRVYDNPGSVDRYRNVPNSRWYQTNVIGPRRDT